MAVAVGPPRARAAINEPIHRIPPPACPQVLPSAFYARLAWHRLGGAAKAGLLCMLCLALCMALLVTGINACELLPACHGWMHPSHEG